MGKRILLSLKRRRSNLFTVILLTCMLSLAFIGVLVYRAASQSMEELEHTYATSFSIGRDRGTTVSPDFYEVRDFQGGFTSKVYIGPGVTYDMMEQIYQEVDGIKEYEAGSLWQIVLYNFNLVPGSNQWLLQTFLNGNYEEWELTDSLEYYVGNSYITYAYATHNSMYFEKFFDGSFELSEGEHILPGQKHVTMISEELARRNNIQVGDQINIDVSSHNSVVGDLTSLKTIEAKVVGLFRTTYQQETNEFTNEQDILNNWVLVDQATGIEMAEICGWDETRVEYDNFYVEDANKLDEVMEQVESLDWIEWKYFNLTKDDTLYANALAPLKTIKNIMLIALWIIVLASVALFYFVLVHSVKNREREAGILLALGISAKEIRRQIRWENLILGAVAFILAFGIGMAVAPAIGDQLLNTFRGEEQKIYTAEEIEAMMRRGENSEAVANAANLREGIEVQETLGVKMEPIYVLLTGVAELILILFCVQLALDQTLKWEPSRVLSMI